MAKRIKDSRLGALVSSATKALSSNEQVFLLLISGSLGALCGFLSFILEWMTGFFHQIFFGKSLDAFSSVPLLYAFAIIPFIPALGGLLVGLLTWGTKMGHETAAAAEVMKWTAVDGGQVPPKIVWYRMLATSIFLGSGGSGGREGPITQICGAMASAIGQFMKVSSERLRLLVGCGAAAGIAATFNAPLAGVIFTVELILGDFNVISFLPIVISSVMATTVKRLLLGDIPAFETPPYSIVSPWEIGLYCILGIICGLVARLFFICYFWAEEYFKESVKIHPILKPAIGGFVVGVIGVFLPGVFGNGYEVMGQMLNGEMLIGMAIALLLFKIIATSVALGSGGSGGLFAPALFVGSMTGGVFGFIVNYLAPGAVASPGAYAMVGLGAVMAAVVHAPLTNILMAYELTGNYQIILPIMTSCILSTYVMTRFTDESLYTEKLRRRGIRLWRGRDLTIMDKITVGEVMSSSVTTVPEHLPFGQLMKLITTSRDSYFPVVSAENTLTGIISLQNVREFMLDSADLCDLVVAKEIATLDVITVTPDNNLNEAMEKFAMKDIEQLPVVDAKDEKKILGILSRTDVLSAYKKDVLRKPMEDTPAG